MVCLARDTMGHEQGTAARYDTHVIACTAIEPAVGFEPTTYRLQVGCATGLRHAGGVAVGILPLGCSAESLAIGDKREDDETEDRDRHESLRRSDGCNPGNDADSRHDDADHASDRQAAQDESARSDLEAGEHQRHHEGQRGAFITETLDPRSVAGGQDQQTRERRVDAGYDQQHAGDGDHRGATSLAGHGCIDHLFP
jgi:hypothetical protein